MSYTLNITAKGTGSPLHSGLAQALTEPGKGRVSKGSSMSVPLEGLIPTL